MKIKQRALAWLWRWSVLILCLLADHVSAVATRTELRGHIPAAVARAAATGNLAATNEMFLSIGLPLRNPAELDELIRQLYDPRSTNFHRFLSVEEFTARFGPSENDYAALQAYAQANGFAVAGTHSNRLVLDVHARADAVERAFQIRLRTYRHPSAAREFFAPDTEPSVPTNLSVADVWGLSDYGGAKPLSRPAVPPQVKALGGSGPSGYYAGNDFRNAYAPGSPLTGAGQTVGLLQFSDYFKSDVTNYQRMIGMTNFVPLTNVVLPGGTPTTANNNEVCLDIETAIAMAPQLSRVIVYEIRSVNPSSILSRMASDNLAKNLSSSWSWSGGPSTTVDNALKQMIAQGQSFFQASGDSDAYTGSQILGNASQINAPVDSTNLTSVGGTTLTMNGSGASWSSERVWNYNSFAPNIGSGGGVSSYYTLPSWQTNLNTNSTQGSATFRNVPDVALTGDGVSVCYNSGGVSVTNALAGTSCAAPLWAGFCALVNQQAQASSGTSVGFINPAIYALASTTNYANCFHDITSGNNIGTNTPGLYNATNGYDLCTGLGTPNGVNLINALAPLGQPFIVTQPQSLAVIAGSNISFTAVALGQAPLAYQWQRNGTNLAAAGNISGNNTNVLNLTATTNDVGNYTLIISNAVNVITSSVASLNVGTPPVFLTQPTNLTLFAGSSASFTATLSGSAPLAYQWRKNSTNLANGTGISGATTNQLSLTSLTTNSSGNYSLTVTNLYGSVTSSVAVLNVVLPPAIVASSLTNNTLECGQNTNTFSLTLTGTAPLAIQWSLDGLPVTGATNATLALTNLSRAIHTLAVVVTNFYASVSSNAVLTVNDSLAPTLTLLGAAVFTNELGAAFTDPGATAVDACAGSVSVLISGSVNVAQTGTNTLTYKAGDGNGNTNTATRTVIVRDTTPPVITWSYTNLTLVLGTNCIAPMPDVTGTNFILASDLSGALTITQNPTNNFSLPLGTNSVVITVADASGNKSFATNRIVVRDQTPPRFLAQPLSQTNLAGTSATLTAAATACTPLNYQWFFNANALIGQTNATLTLANLRVTNSGNYFAVVSADGGATTSSVAALTVNLQGSVLMLSVSNNPVGYRDAVALFASLTPTNASGSIQFFTNGAAFDAAALVAGAAASRSLTNLPRGTNALAAIFLGAGIYQDATNTFALIVTNHPPAVTTVDIPLLAGSDLNLLVAELATNWSDADGDALFIAAVSPSTNGVVVTNDLPTLFYHNPNLVDDQFTCTVSDGFGGTNFQTINLVLVPQTNSTPFIATVAVQPSARVQLNLQGGYGSTYVLESTADFASGIWEAIATNTLGLTGTWSFTDTNAANTSQRFYRLKKVE